MAFELVVAPDAGESEQHEREHRVARGDRRVLELFGPRNTRVPVRGRQEEAAVLGIREELDSEQREPASFEQPAKLSRRHVQLDEAVCDVRVVVEVRVAARARVPPRTQQSPVLAGQRPEQKLPYATSSFEPVVAFEAVRGFGERSEREPVP